MESSVVKRDEIDDNKESKGTNSIEIRRKKEEMSRAEQ